MQNVNAMIQAFKYSTTIYSCFKNKINSHYKVQYLKNSNHFKID